MKALFIPFLLLYSLPLPKTSLAGNIFTKTQFLKDGETIVSNGGTFEMGFFSPTNSSNRYVGIWYKQIPGQTVVWVANRDAPIKNTSSAVLKITLGGQLSLVGDNSQAVWSANISRSVQNPVAELLDTGNLVVRDADDENPENFLWQSFDFPTDHYLPGMKLGRNLVSGHEVYVTARKHDESPASGEYTFHLDPTGYPQAVIKNGSTEIYGLGPWNGLRFSGTRAVDQNNTHDPNGLVINKKEVYIWYNLNKDLGVFRFFLTSNGVLEAWIWEDQRKEWVNLSSVPSDDCDTYGLCGANGVCNVGKYPPCGCLDKFLPNNRTAENPVQACHRRNPLNCHNGSTTDGFLKYSGVKLPDTKQSWYNETMTLQECEEICLRNCSCMAYSSLNISEGGTGCLLWLGDLVDIRWLSENGQDIYIRLASSEVPAGPETGSIHSSSKKKKVLIIVLCLSLLVLVLLVGCLLSLWYFCKRRIAKQAMKKELELPLFDLSTITRATISFSENNKLGHGGFGDVYKGVLNEGQEIAVKRLSKTSTQGLEEFKNEVICIAKLQHRNLVKLLGCYISGEEKMLIYEYMPNKSLDFFIFDETRKKLLDWHKRFNIINGIARGLLYLHQDSRLRVIHRDLKASNILLDIDLNPKISDFGLARSVRENETGDQTKRVARTHGYISPEYAAHGMFSVKSDVFSYGVLVQEIVSGRRNNDFCDEDQYETLPGHAWKLNIEGRSIALVDEHIADSCDVVQVLRSIHVGLLCVQQNPNDRPTMSSVVQMLVNDVALPQPKEPGFFSGKREINNELSPVTRATSSINEVTMTSLHPRSCLAMETAPLFFAFLSFLSILQCCVARDAIIWNQTLRQGDTIVSANGAFEMGFFSPPNSQNLYVGIWYRNINPQTVCWVANRENPIKNSSSMSPVLRMSKKGVLDLIVDTNTTIWSSTATRSVANPVARLLDSGNLVVKDDDDSGDFVWQSFVYATDMLLTGQGMGKNFVTGHEVYLSSWKSDSDPSPGDFSLHCDPTGWIQCFVRRNGTIEVSRSGPWNGLGWSGVPALRAPFYIMNFINDKTQVFISYTPANTHFVSHLMITKDGVVERNWVDNQWQSYHSLPQDNCDQYGLCSPNGYCNIEKSPPCACLDKFLPKDSQAWRRPDFSKGCVRRAALDCHENASSDGFLKFSGIKLPDTKKSRFNQTMTLQECERVCLRNCSCTAYSTLNISDGSGCLLWFGDLIDIRHLSEIGQDIYIRMASSELPKNVNNGRGKKHTAFVVSLSAGIGAVLVIISLLLYYRKKKKDYDKLKKDLELPLFDLSKITRATNNFSDDNKLGEGGFGPVYKGVMKDGQAIAVKRLSKASTQGINEFKNEVICIAKLQHRNLVKLLGCCIHGDEKMLIYEYMPNKSLDLFIFDETKKKLLDWPKCFNIIIGIARGLLYLHQDSHLRIIHRDLKASNILLDTDLNPKISDFGLARSVKGNETGANTNLVAGTYGYMSPEYAVHGAFSVKSDVFSFGVSVIEIISGKRNRGFRHQDHCESLLGHAWKLFTDGRSGELIDEHLAEPCHLPQVLRSIHVGLLCVQQHPEDRPSMSSIVKMLDSEDVLHEPKEPGFFTESSSRVITDAESSTGQRTTGSINELSTTMLYPR
ncbi:PREDICTED: uncharacterized protein LOC109149200 [Ipomoea nil]|uniref:uncharacterized protein LOC109149200 n=1 Tax=Ipomoea nil TaxID=35883 RepID=UPI000901915E|nr:PREDICTED: uncharacterized protein LOC109149200 [Ipomoea nil]